ncbi:MAG: hypothetical protein ABSF91_10260 [Bacteroidota bacterium]|jgi:hypothetical protein
MDSLDEKWKHWIDRYSNYAVDEKLKRSIPFDVRLNRIGLTEREFKLYYKRFVKAGTRYWTDERHDEREQARWRQKKRLGKTPALDINIPLNEYEVVKHLAGEFHVAKQMSGKNDFFVIDLDSHKDNGTPIEERYRAVIQIFGLPMVFRSSESGGLHLYYFLEKPMWRPSIWASIEEIIRYNPKLRPKPGNIEYFPGTIDHLRLPLGKGSMLLDPNSLFPMGLNLKQSIWYVAKHRREATIDFKKRIAELALSAGPVPISSPPRSRPSTKYSILPPSQTKSQLVHEPIAEYGTRNQVQMKHIRKCIDELGLSAEETFSEIWDSYYDPIMNHKSKDLTNPKQLQVELKAAIQNWVGKRLKGSKGRSSIRSAPLSVEDVKHLLFLTNPLKSAEKYGRESHNMVKFLFRLFAHFKASGATVLPISFNMLAKMGSKVTARRYKDYCLQNGILTLVEGGSWRMHQCCKYQLNYIFVEGTTVSSLEEGICKLFTGSELFRSYERRIYDVLRRSYR